VADSDITIVGLQAIGGVSQIVASWSFDDPNAGGLPYLRFKKAEVRYSLSASMSSPVSLGFASTAIVDLPVPRGEQRFYQARAIDQSDQEGEWCGIVPAREISGDVLIATNGYWKLPSGLILQWGLSQVSDLNGHASANFSIPFPHQCFVCVGVTTNNNPAAVVSAGLEDLRSDFAVFRLTAVFDFSGFVLDVSVGVPVWFIAVGY
jgi:hypothetical protein